MSKVAKSFICRGCLNPVTSACRTSVDIRASAKLELVDKFCYLGDMLRQTLRHWCLQCFDAVGWVAGRASGRQSGGCWCGCLSGARCRLAYGPADATATHCLLLQ